MDLSIMVNNYRLNIRVGIIFKYQKQVLIEIPLSESNSVIPGGRVKLGEETKKTIIREVKEELNYDLDIDKLVFKKVYENFFNYNGIDVHELFFVYQYKMNKKTFDELSLIHNNCDNENSYFKFVSLDELEKYNLLPKTLVLDIKNTR